MEIAANAPKAQFWGIAKLVVYAPARSEWFIDIYGNAQRK